MFKKKRNLIFASCLVGLLATTTAATLALSSCKTNSSPSKPETPENPSTPSTPSKPDEKPYESVIDWNNETTVNNLITDSSGLVYSDNTKTIVIAVKPEVTSSTITIPSKVKSIMGYTRVVYKDSNGVIHENRPSSGKYTEEKQVWGAFQGMDSLNTIVLESGSQLENIGKLAFLDCKSLKNIQGTASNLKYVGSHSFGNCNSLQSIDTSTVTRIDDSAFSNCTSLTKIDLSNTLAIGNRSFANCSSLSSLGSLAKLTSIDREAFFNATKEGADITIKLSSLNAVTDSAFAGTKGISTVDFSNNTTLSTIVDNAFLNSLITNVDFSGCSKLASISQRSFENCVNLTNVYLPANSVTSLTTVGWNAFAKCGKLVTVAPKSTNTGFIATSKLSYIGKNAFANTAIASVDLSSFVIDSANSGKPLGSEFALAFITQLSSITLPNNITTLNAGMFYKSGINSTNGFKLNLPKSITNIIYSSSVSIPDADSDYIYATVNVHNATPFTGSGVSSVDMSQITSYQSDNATTIPNYLFNDNAKLKSVVLKTDTTAIGESAFKDTTALTSITYSSSSSTAVDTDTTNGFKASSALKTINNNAFENAFDANSNATVDLSSTTIETTPTAFNSSNITSLVLPTSITTIAASSFDDMPKLTSVNFGDLVNLTKIEAPNFNKTKLTTIDLSNTKGSSNLFSGVSTTNKLFTGLPTNCIVSLPATLGSFDESIFIGTDSKPVYFSYPNGILFDDTNGVGKVSGNVFSFVKPDDQRISKLKNINLSNNSAIHSIGSNTFFGNSNLNSITLKAEGISGGVTAEKGVGLFSTTNNITANSSNSSSAASYNKESVPFGNNTELTSLNYVGFTLNNNATTGKTSQETLFNKTSETTWAEIAKIISSLSYQPSDSTVTAASVTPNMKGWTAYNSPVNPMNTDIRNYWDSRTASQVMTNLYYHSNDPIANAIFFKADTSSVTFMHNGATWTYTNDGSTIKLTSKVNMYKLSDASSKNYLVYFSQFQNYSPGSGSGSYYIPGGSINVTLTVATASNPTTK